MAETDIFELGRRYYWRRKWNAGRISLCTAERWRHRHLAGIRDLSAGNGLDRRAIKSNIKHREFSIIDSLARCLGGELRATGRPRCISLLRVVRSAKYPRNRKYAARKWRRPCHDYAANQTVPRRENVVRAFLDASPSRVLAARTGREIFHQITGNDSLLLAARSDAVAAARGDSATRNSGLA